MLTPATGVTFAADVIGDLTLADGDAVMVHVDRATGRASVRRVKASDVTNHEVPLDWARMEAEAQQNARKP